MNFIRFVSTLLVLLGIIPKLLAQPAERFRQPFANGQGLFDRELFANAQSLLLDQLESSQGLQAEFVAYTAVRSALELLNPDAERMAMNFESQFPESRLLRPLQLHTANHFFINRKFSKAREWFEKADADGYSGQTQDEIAFKTAYSHFAEGHYAQAKPLFQKVQNSSGNYKASAIYYTSFIDYNDSNYVQAGAGFEKLNNDPQFGQVVPYYLAQIYYKTERYNELMEVANSILKREEVVRRDEIERLLADTYYRKANYAEAAIHFERFKEYGGTFRREDHYQLGYAYYQTARYAEAIQSFNRITQADGPLSQDAWYHLGDCYLRTGDKNKALTAFEAASRLDASPDMKKQSRYLYAKLNYELQGPFDPPAKVIVAFAKDYPNTSETKYLNKLLADIYIREKNYERALEAIREAGTQSIEMKSAYQKVSYFRGIELFNAAKYKEAIAVWNDSRQFAINPQWLALSYYWTGEAHYRLGAFKEALENYETFRASSGASGTDQYIKVLYDLGHVQLKLKQYANSITNFKNFIAAYKTEDARRSDARLRAADAHFVGSAYAQALELYKEALRFNSKEGDYALLQKGMCEGLLGREDDKISSLSKLERDFPNSNYLAEASFEKASSLLRLDKNTDALNAFEAFRIKHQNHPLARQALLNEGLVLRNLDRQAEAVSKLKKVVEDYPSTREAKEAISFARLVYADMGQLDAYIEWVQKIDFANVKEAQLDSTLYNSGYEYYALGDCSKSVTEFGHYLKRFPKGLFVLNAHYFRAACLEKSGDLQAAQTHWQQLFNLGNHEYSAESAFKLGLWAFNKSDFSAANNYFNAPAMQNNERLVRDSRIYRLRMAEQAQNNSLILSLAEAILLDDKSAPEHKTEALLQRARTFMVLNNGAAAKADFEILYQNPKDVSAAEAGFNLAKIAFEAGQFAQSIEQIYAYMERTPGFVQWREQGLALLFENFLAINDYFQARYTLEHLEKTASTPDVRNRLPAMMAKLQKAEKGETQTEASKNQPTLNIENDLPELSIPNEAPDNE